MNDVAVWVLAAATLLAAAIYDLHTSHQIPVLLLILPLPLLAILRGAQGNLSCLLAGPVLGGTFLLLPLLPQALKRRSISWREYPWGDAPGAAMVGLAGGPLSLLPLYGVCLLALALALAMRRREMPFYPFFFLALLLTAGMRWIGEL
ncbi:MAG: hypothetical protein ACP5OO_11180 [Chloroflexia bacterium]